MVSFAVWLAWNTWWLVVESRLAPSLLTAIGVPCPTTGCTRSLLALSRGELAASWHYHPLAMPIALLFAVTVAWTGLSLVRRRRPLLPAAFLRVWGLALALAWVAKLAVDFA